MTLHRVNALDEDEAKAMQMLMQHEGLLVQFVIPALAELLERVEALEVPFDVAECLTDLEQRITDITPLSPED